MHLSLRLRCTKNNRDLTGSKYSTSSAQFVFSGQSVSKDGHHGIWFAEDFSIFFFCSRWTELDKTYKYWTSFTNFRVLGWSVNNNSRHGLKLSGTFRHLLCNGWTEFDKANPTSSTKFLIFGPTRRSIWPLGLCLGETLSTSKNGFMSASYLLNPLFIYVPTATPIAAWKYRLCSTTSFYYAASVSKVLILAIAEFDFSRR